MITVTNEVKVYEVDGQDLPINENENIIVSSHWNHRERVNIFINGRKVTVIADDLRAAITNATNINRF